MRIQKCTSHERAGARTGNFSITRAAILVTICCGLWGGAAYADDKGDWGVGTHQEHESIADNDNSRPIQPESGVLTFERRDIQDFAGTVVSKSGVVKFRAIGLTEGGQKVVGAARPSFTRIVIDLDGVPIDVEFNEKSQNVQIRQSTGLIIEPKHQAMLQTFGVEVQRQLFINHQDPARLSVTEQRLWRLTEMYAEVPNGYRFDSERNVALREPVIVNNDLSTKVQNDSIIDLDALESDLVLNDELLKACVSGGVDDLYNLKNAKDVCDRKKTATRTARHDFCPTHGYLSETTAYGCASSNCRGRCGPGCTMGILPSGMGAYGQDCLDHDVCNQAHNSQLGGCSDEFNDAADDYLLLTISCYTGCKN